MYCPVHGLEFKLIPAGTSKKTGKPYKAFYVCPEPECKEKPGGESQPPVGSKSSPTEAPAKAVDWDKKGRQMNRSNLAAAILQNPNIKTMAWSDVVDILDQAEKWVLDDKRQEPF